MTPRTNEKKAEICDSTKKTRFRIEKLEERIAPWCPKINPHGKCVGWRKVRGDL